MFSKIGNVEWHINGPIIVFGSGDKFDACKIFMESGSLGYHYNNEDYWFKNFYKAVRLQKKPWKYSGETIDFWEVPF